MRSLMCRVCEFVPWPHIRGVPGDRPEATERTIDFPVRLKPDTTDLLVRLKPDTTDLLVRLKPDTTYSSVRRIVRLEVDRAVVLAV